MSWISTVTSLSTQIYNMSSWCRGGLFWTVFPLCVPLLWSFVSSPLHSASLLGVPAVRQLQVSLSGTFYQQVNSAPPPFVAGSTGSALLSTKQTVNSRFMPLGYDTSTTYSPNIFLHGTANRKKGGFVPLLQLISRKGSCSWLSEHFPALKWHLHHFTLKDKFSLLKYLLISCILLLFYTTADHSS